MHQYPASTDAWKKKMEWFTTIPHYRELDRIDGEPTEFDWKIFPGHTTFQILEEIPKMMDDMKCEIEQFMGRIIFMSMFHDIVWGSKYNKEKCVANSWTVAEYA